MSLLGNLFLCDEFHSHFLRRAGQMPQHALAVTFLVVVLTLIGVFLALVLMSRASLCTRAVTTLSLSMRAHTLRKSFGQVFAKTSKPRLCEIRMPGECIFTYVSHAYARQTSMVCNEDVRDKNREPEMKSTVWFEKILPKTEPSVQNGVFLQLR
ncbi:MAG: hypothetical protein WAT12_06470 [Candidatus Nitrotoga sp.]